MLRSIGPAVLLLAAALCPGAGCSGKDCGPGGAPADGLTLTPTGGSALAFGQVHSSPNNDCPPAGGGGPTSLTLSGSQTAPGGASGILTLCLPRPDQLGTDPIPLDDAQRVQVVDLQGHDASGCLLALDRSGSLAGGAIAFAGVCNNGTDAAGYAVTLSGSLPVTSSCPGAADAGAAITASLGGTVAVTADQP